MLHQMKLRQKPYDGIKTGYKTIELRLYDKKRQKINAGDEIEFTCTENENEKITKKVSKIEVFDNFEQLFKGVPLLACGYSPFEIQIASADDMNAYYFEEVQRKYKAVAIYLEEKPFQKYLAAQSGCFEASGCSGYEKALEEIKSGGKTTHWIWYILPQLKSLPGDVPTKYYGLSGVDQAKEYYCHSVVGERLKEICRALITAECDDPVVIMGSYIDAFKLRDSMKLFLQAVPEEALFSAVLEKYYRSSLKTCRRSDVP